jgi:hypothetical protein
MIAHAGGSCGGSQAGSNEYRTAPPDDGSTALSSSLGTHPTDAASRGGHSLDAFAEHPLLTKRIAHPPGPLAVKLIGQRVDTSAPADTARCHAASASVQ